MENLFYLLVVVFLHLVAIDCEKKPILDIVVSIDDGKSSIEVYKADENDLILKENNNSYNLKKLNWYSIGNPIIIKTKSNTKNKSEIFFHFRNDGFYLNVQFLSDLHKKMIIQEIREKYGITIQLHQIKEIPLEEFNCDFYLSNYNDETIVKGSTKGSLTKFPLRVDFKSNEEELKFLSQSDDNDWELECDYKSKIGLEETLIVKFDKPLKVILWINQHKNWSFLAFLLS